MNKELFNTPAQKAGLKTQDIITIFNGKPVTSTQQLADQAKNISFGDVAKVTVNRSGAGIPISIKLLNKDELLTIRSSQQKNVTTENNHLNETEEKIKSLGRLFEKGLLSQEEYSSKKAELLKKY